MGVCTVTGCGKNSAVRFILLKTDVLPERTFEYCDSHSELMKKKFGSQELSIQRL